MRFGALQQAKAGRQCKSRPFVRREGIAISELMYPQKPVLLVRLSISLHEAVASCSFQSATHSGRLFH